MSRNIQRTAIILTLSSMISNAQAIKDCEANYNNAAPILIGKQGYYFSPFHDLRDLPYDANEKEIASVVGLLNQKGIEVIIVPVPNGGVLHGKFLDPSDPRQASFNQSKSRLSYTRFVDNLTNYGLNVVNVLKLADKNPDGFFLKSDWHWTPEGAEATAIEVARIAKSLPAYSKIEQRDFSISRTGTQKIAANSAYYTSNIIKRCPPK